jgi:hypothetical protein
MKVMYALFYAATQCFATEAETEGEVYQLAMITGWEEELKSGQAYILPI